MLTGKPDPLDRVAQSLVFAVGLFALLFGLFMIAKPLDWYVSLPTVITTGPPNKHFIRDIGIAYAACGIMLLYASANIHTRWLAVLTGALWLSLHGILHIYEVTVGICSVGVFWADAPGVLGPSILVFIALAIIFARRRIAPAGLPKSVIIKATEGSAPQEVAYLREIAAAPGGAFEKFAHFMPATLHRHDAPADIFHAARIAATLAEDCGPCALTAAEGALVDGVSREKINLMLASSSDLQEGEALAFKFGTAVAAQSADAFELGDEIEALYGRSVRLELAMTVATVRSYPAMKRGLGLTKSCSLTKLEI